MSEPTLNGDATRDALLGGELVLWQPARSVGYRYNLDPVLLAGFARPASHFLDLGAGCGVLGFLLLTLGKAERVTAVEIQPELAALAERNAVDNGYSDRFEILVGDLRSIDLPKVDAVIFNPPYFRKGTGHVPPNSGRSIARHELNGTLADFLSRGIESCSPHGSTSGIIPAERGKELHGIARKLNASLSRRRDIQSRERESASHLLFEVASGILETTTESPLVVHEGQGRRYGAEVRGLLREQ